MLQFFFIRKKFLLLSPIETDKRIGEMIQIDLQGTKHDVDVDVTKDTGADVIRKLRNMELIRPDQSVKMIFRGKVIEGETTLKEQGINDGVIVTAILQDPNGDNSTKATSRNKARYEDPSLEIMKLPLFQQLVSNPEIMKSVIQMDPRVKRLIDENPEMADALSDPEIMKQMTEAATNPELAAEMARITDRSINNIESLPGGNAVLRKILGNPDEVEADEHSRMRTRRKMTRK